MQNAENLRSPIHITVSRASAAAIEAIEKAGGSVQTRYYTKASLKRVLRGETHPFLSRLSPPTGTSLAEEEAMKTQTGVGEDEASDTGMESSLAKDVDYAAAGGLHDTRLQLSQFPQPERYKYRLPDAISRKDLEYYRDPAHRGYLAYQVEEGSGPSLFFKSPEQLKAQAAERKKEKRRRIANRSDVDGEAKVDTGRIW